METLIVYLDDADYALQLLAPMRRPSSPPGATTHWILVACAPRLTQHISKWVSHSARNKWRNKWSEQVFSLVTPALAVQGDTVSTMLASGRLTLMTERLLGQHALARVLDARRPKFGQELQPLTANQHLATDSRWSLPSATVAMGAMLVLATD